MKLDKDVYISQAEDDENNLQHFLETVPVLCRRKQTKKYIDESRFHEVYHANEAGLLDHLVCKVEKSVETSFHTVLPPPVKNANDGEPVVPCSNCINENIIKFLLDIFNSDENDADFLEGVNSCPI